jgi:hypothetical protein
MSTWDAIVRLCTLLGAIPEVATWSDGSVGIVIVAADELHGGGQFLRPFRRTVEGVELRHRVLVDGVDVDEVRERRELEAGSRVDFVELVAVDPDEGRTRRSRYGRLGPVAEADLTDPRARFGYVKDAKASGKGTKTPWVRRETGNRRRPHGVTSGRGVFMAAHGVTSQQHLDRLAENAWRSLNQGEFKLSPVEIKAPWSHGGGPDDADLLSLAAGAAVELRFRGLEGLAEGRTGRATDENRGTGLARIGSVEFLSRFYRARGVDPEAAAVFARATLARPLSLVFQTVEVRHSFDGEGDGSYSCSMDLQTWLSDGEPPDVDPQAWREANDEAWRDEQPEEGGEEAFE